MHENARGSTTGDRHHAMMAATDESHVELATAVREVAARAVVDGQRIAVK
jgi:hypothetical protein